MSFQNLKIVKNVQLTDEMNGPGPDKIHTRTQKDKIAVLHLT